MTFDIMIEDVDSAINYLNSVTESDTEYWYEEQQSLFLDANQTLY
jgi:hypothetical protein